MPLSWVWPMVRERFVAAARLARAERSFEHQKRHCSAWSFWSANERSARASRAAAGSRNICHAPLSLSPKGEGRKDSGKGQGKEGRRVRRSRETPRFPGQPGLRQTVGKRLQQGARLGVANQLEDFHCPQVSELSGAWTHLGQFLEDLFQPASDLERLCRGNSPAQGRQRGLAQPGQFLARLLAHRVGVIVAAHGASGRPVFPEPR